MSVSTDLVTLYREVTAAEFKMYVRLLGETEGNHKINFTVDDCGPEEIRNMCLANPSRKLTCLVSRLWYNF